MVFIFNTYKNIWMDVLLADTRYEMPWPDVNDTTRQEGYDS